MEKSRQVKKSRRKKVSISTLLKSEEFYSCFNKDLIDYLKSSIQDDLQVCKALNYLMHKGVLDYKTFLEKYSINNSVKIWSKKGYFVWEKHLVNYMKGSSLRGKKQTKDWVDKMRVWSTKYHENRSQSHKDKLAEHNRSLEFKKTYLTNHGIDINGKNVEEVINLYGKHLSDVRKSAKYKISCIKKFMVSKKYPNELLHSDFVKKYENVEIDETNYVSISSETASIISTVAMTRNENMGQTKFFKTGYIKVKHCKNKTLIRYRSSWELSTINFLENNKIQYEYEPFYIRRLDGKTYLPDFLILINNELILLEIKGFIRGKSGKENEQIKIDSAIEYCKLNNIRFIYLKKPLTNINQILN